MRLRKIGISVLAHAGVLACSMFVSLILSALIFALIRPGIYSGLSVSDMMQWERFQMHSEGVRNTALMAVLFFLPVHAAYTFFRKAFKPVEVVAFTAVLWGVLSLAFIALLYG